MEQREQTLITSTINKRTFNVPQGLQVCLLTDAMCRGIEDYLPDAECWVHPGTTLERSSKQHIDHFETIHNNTGRRRQDTTLISSKQLVPCEDSVSSKQLVPCEDSVSSKQLVSSLMKSDDLKWVELRLQTADGLLRRNISTTREYWVTYVPVVVNMTASSPEEQMLGTKRRGMNEKCNIHLPRGRGKRSLSEILTRTTRTSRRRSYQKLSGVGSPLCQWEMSFPSLCLCSVTKISCHRTHRVSAPETQISQIFQQELEAAVSIFSFYDD
ncbi:hypothetical protein HF521_017027 [Silurus meridionalis]|uniref:Uncharacterized protein n=1 Tax=Silurus meridionalis TaxID=175797 RepID=A0A8T0BRM3_SILME|nr:hypothetical protein HF521_017027 [Silurus meridionalis]